MSVFLLMGGSDYAQTRDIYVYVQCFESVLSCFLTPLLFLSKLVLCEVPAGRSLFKLWFGFCRTESVSASGAFPSQWMLFVEKPKPTYIETENYFESF